MKQPQPTLSQQVRRLGERDFDLRKLRYFVAVAAEANFGRAAARLYMTQPALSRQIQSLEAEIGVRLFDRDWHGARLTPAGEQFRDDAQRLLDLSEAITRRARQAARSPARFTVGFMPGMAATPVIREFAQSLPEADIRVVHTSPSNQADYLLAGRVDICFVRMPLSPRLFDIVPLFLEPQVIALPADHPLAAKENLSVEHLRGLDRVGLDGPPPYQHGTSRNAPIEEQLERVALGLGYAVLPESTATFYHRRDITYLRVAGLDEVQVAVARDKARPIPEFGRFACIAQRLLTGTPRTAARS